MKPKTDRSHTQEGGCGRDFKPRSAEPQKRPRGTYQNLIFEPPSVGGTYIFIMYMRISSIYIVGNSVYPICVYLYKFSSTIILIYIYIYIYIYKLFDLVDHNELHAN